MRAREESERSRDKTKEGKRTRGEMKALRTCFTKLTGKYKDLKQLPF